MFFHYDRTYVFNFKLINKKNISSESLVREKYEEKKNTQSINCSGFQVRPICFNLWLIPLALNRSPIQWDSPIAIYKYKHQIQGHENTQKKNTSSCRYSLSIWCVFFFCISLCLCQLFSSIHICVVEPPLTKPLFHFIYFIYETFYGKRIFLQYFGLK